MDTPILSDIKVLDNLLALNLNVNLWSARKKMVLEDFGGAELPPEDLASLGSKRIADPNSLKVFVTLKARAFNYLDRHGIRFMSGWAIPEDKAGDIIKELNCVRELPAERAKQTSFCICKPALRENWMTNMQK